MAPKRGARGWFVCRIRASTAETLGQRYMRCDPHLSDLIILFGVKQIKAFQPLNEALFCYRFKQVLRHT